MPVNHVKKNCTMPLLCLKTNLEAVNIKKNKKMDPPTKRNKKSDKAKKTFERNGGNSAKHVRKVEELQEKNKVKGGGNGKPSES